MQIFIVIHGSPWTSQAAISALRFAEAAIATGHSIYRVFFYHDAVATASSHTSPAADEAPVGKLWSEFAQRRNMELIICISAALRRGIVEEKLVGEADGSTSLLPGFAASGLGQYVDGVLTADRVISFGG